MRSLRKPVYFTRGNYTVSLGTGRTEFNPKKERPGLEHYIAEARRGALAQIPDAAAVDEGVVHPRRGGLLLGLEVQNTVKAIYGAEKTWAAMGRWYEQAIVNARKNPKAQQFHNTTEDLFAAHQAMKPNGKSFCDHIDVLDCSKVSDGGAAVDQIGVFETHDCFTITGILACEALGLASAAKGPTTCSPATRASKGRRRSTRVADSSATATRPAPRACAWPSISGSS